MKKVYLRLLPFCFVLYHHQQPSDGSREASRHGLRLCTGSIDEYGRVLFRTTTPDIIEGVIVKRSERLHWSLESAMDEAQGWADELTNPNPAGKIEWRNVDYNMAIGRLVDQPNYTAVARSMLLPQGRPPRKG